MVTRIIPGLVLMLCVIGAGGVQGAARFITLASTTSTANSGLLDIILPRFTAESGIAVRVVTVGSGAALKLGERGDVDVVLVHARTAEDRFIEAGFGIDRRAVMYNDFIIVGPVADPAAIAGMTDAPEALRRIAAVRAPFVSRGDDSGTHKAELRLWREIDRAGVSGDADWYREVGAGMGATLNTARAMAAYSLVDRGTWLSFVDRGGLALLVEGDPRLMNPYSVILVSPERHPHVKATAAAAFMDWLTGLRGQAAIDAFTLNGERLFTPSAE